MTSLISWSRDRDNALWLALMLSGGLLVAAYISEYVFGFIPCQMCWWQRYAHMGVVALSVLGLVLPKLRLKCTVFVVVALLTSFSIALWHVGVEYGLIDAPATCGLGNASGGLGAIDPNDPLSMLDKRVTGPACTEAVWHFLGLSMAAWNAIASLIGALWIATLRVR